MTKSRTIRNTLSNDMENMEKNCEMIWKIWKKGKLNSEKIWKIRYNNVGRHCCHHGRCQCNKDDILTEIVIYSVFPVKTMDSPCQDTHEFEQTLVCHLGRCQCTKNYYWDGRRCIHINYIVLSS